MWDEQPRHWWEIKLIIKYYANGYEYGYETGDKINGNKSQLLLLLLPTLQWIGSYHLFGMLCSAKDELSRILHETCSECEVTICFEGDFRHHFWCMKVKLNYYFSETITFWVYLCLPFKGGCNCSVHPMGNVFRRLMNVLSRKKLEVSDIILLIRSSHSTLDNLSAS